MMGFLSRLLALGSLFGQGRNNAPDHHVRQQLPREATDEDFVWVPNDQVCELTNIWGRKWKTADGSFSGTYYGKGSIPDSAMSKGILWRFYMLGNIDHHLTRR